jgi:hypothetical protein
MVNYKNSKIYKIESITGEGDIFIGGTTKNYICNTFNQYKGNYNQYLKGDYHFLSVFEIFNKYGVNNCKITIIERFSCNDKDELNRKVGEHVKNTDCVNKRMEGRTKNEYYNDNIEYIKKYRIDYEEKNKDKIIEYQKIYREENKDIIKIKNKEYYDVNKETLIERRKIYVDQNKDLIKDSQKKYYENNRDIIIEKKKKYNNNKREFINNREKEKYNINKDIINEKRKEKILCICGSDVRKCAIKRHERTTKHIDFINK